MKYIRPILRSKLFRFFFIIYLAFFVFDKAFSIDIVHENLGTITNLTPGQLQNFNPLHLMYMTVFKNEFDFFDNSPNQYHFHFYGQPGTISLRGNELQGPIHEYDYLISSRINANNSSVNDFRNYFLTFQHQPYPATGDTDGDTGGDTGGGGGSNFDINDLDFNLAATFFAGGFAIFLLPWLNAYGFSALLSFIKRA
jgi:hypothetical protein